MLDGFLVFLRTDIVLLPFPPERTGAFVIREAPVPLFISATIRIGIPARDLFISSVSGEHPVNCTITTQAAVNNLITVPYFIIYRFL